MLPSFLQQNQTNIPPVKLIHNVPLYTVAVIANISST